MAEGIARFIVGKLEGCIVDPIFRQIKHLFFYNSNIQNLENKVQELERKRNDEKLRVGAAERNNEIIGEQVSSWLLKVDDLKEKANEILNSEASSEMGCLFNMCPNLMSRCSYSKKAAEKAIEADELRAVTFERVGYARPPVQVLNLTSHKGFETRLSTKKKIKEALKDKDIGIIGICGMPGVGKTTMAKEIVNEVKDEKLFEEVAFSVVSNDPDIYKIQDQLIDALGLKIEEKTNIARAGRLRQRLEGNNDKSILVILDDVWKEIDLGTIGIPSPHDRKGLKIMFTTRNEETCHIMEAQRKFEIKVLDEKEGWQLFKDTAGVSDDETDVELVSMAKKVAYECRGLPLALVVVGKALKSNKAAHKWRDALRQLQSSATDLEGMENNVYKSIRLSYDYLVSNEERDLLLLCSLFAEDESIPIEILVRYARGLELFRNTKTLDQTRDRAKTIADNLKGRYLLQPGKGEDEVKLHDVIRDFCIHMAYEDKRGYLVNHAGLKEWPELDADESCSAISITFDELGQLPSGLKYQNVKLLRVICRKLGECIISEEFFKDMKELRVLELEGMYIQIPSSIKLLMGLRTLCLIKCKIRSQLPMIGSLKKLEILSFYRSSFDDNFPIELGNLSNLRSLDLRFRELSCPLRPGVFLGKTKLEELYLGGSISGDGEDQRSIIEELSSLTSLRTFEIRTSTPILMQILKTLCCDKLEKFRTATPQYNRLTEYEDQRFTRNLSLLRGTEASMLLQPEFLSLMRRTYHLEIEQDEVLKNLVSELDGEGFINLKALSLWSCDFKYLIDATNSIPNGTFSKLESLQLTYLPKLIEIYNGNLPRGIIKPQLFCNLTRVSVLSCDTIRSLFRESVAKCLVNLQSLKIGHCPMLEEVVSADARENEATKTCERLEFPKLREVRLSCLRRFKSFTSTLFNQVNFPNIAESDSIQPLQNLECLDVWKCNALEVLFDFEGIKVTNDDARIIMLGRLRTLALADLRELVNITRMVPKGICVFQNLTNLTVEGCHSLRYLFSPSLVNSLVALEYLSIYNCEAMEEIIGREEEENTSETRNIVMGANSPSNLHHFTQVVSMDAKLNEVIDMPEFPKLITLELRYLSSFKSFRSESKNDGILRTLFNQVTLPNMKELEIEGLHNIVMLVNTRLQNSSKSLQNLEKLKVKCCTALEVLFDLECLKITEDHAESVFGRLRSLELQYLDKLVHIIGTVPKGIRVFESLTSIVVDRCGILKYIFSPSMAYSLEALNILEVSNCESIKAIVGKEEEEEGTSEIKTRIEFPKLDRLVLRNLSSIQMFCSHNCELVFPLLKDPTIENCPMMRKLSHGQ